MTTTTLLAEPRLDRTLTLDPARIAPARRAKEPLLREAIGMSLRAYRADKGVSLRELASQALVSPGYLSELERGRKEVSSEVLASICEALDTSVADLLLEAVSNLSLTSIADELSATTPAAAEV
ncbi:helix-turn-helix transcriptional regulator [Corynebacterium sp. Q4381]|uniref:helix-turn-helix domain-containing protein n=1 Tax=Corynebacterium sp. Marseille-Q4381 TaxID=3121597 RepID=UPI002FE62914